jgi:hypothetical protein
LLPKKEEASMEPARGIVGKLKIVRRPRQYRSTVAERVCALVCRGVGLRDIAARAGMPTLETLHRWLDEDAAFRRSYASACKLQRTVLSDDVVTLTDAIASPDNAGLKLRTDARRWRVAELRQDEDTGGGAQKPDFDEEVTARLQAALDRVNAADGSGGAAADDESETDGTGR